MLPYMYHLRGFICLVSSLLNGHFGLILTTFDEYPVNCDLLSFTKEGFTEVVFIIRSC